MRNFSFSLTSFIHTRRNQIILLVLLLLILTAALTSFLSMQKASQNGTKSQNAQSNSGLSPNTNGKNIPRYSVIYGTWETDSSVISSYDLASQKDTVIVRLPFAIKHVTSLSPSELLYVDGTNDYDQGTKISVKNITENTTYTLLSSDPGFKIDNYVLSQNKKYLAIWEVSFLQNANSVLGGRSRVYALDVSHPLQKNLLYDEISQANVPVHYPIAVTNNAEIVLDTFTPNDGAGWGFGWSTSNLTGSDKKIIPQLQNGTVSIRPLISPSGSLLLFSAYDGSTGPGTEYIGTFRKALIAPNTLQVFNAATNTVQKIHLPTTDRYTPVNWQINSAGFVYKVVSPDFEKNGMYYYNLATQKSTKIELPQITTTYNPTVLATFSQNEILLGNQNNNTIDLSNLGSTYAMSINSMSLLQNNQIIENTSVRSAQYIETVASSYFKKSASIAGVPTATPKVLVTTVPVFSSTNSSPRQLQLEALSFTYKSYLGELPNQQTPTSCDKLEPAESLADPICNRCVSVAAQTCNNMLGTSFVPSYWVDMPRVQPQIKPLKGVPTINPAQITSKYKAFLECYFQTYLDITVMLCNDSPLYLYGEKGTQVEVRANVPIDNSSAPYNPIHGFQTTLDTNGSFFIQDKLYNKISFDYVPGIKHLPRPQSGIIMKKTDILEKMTWYGKQLGLNIQETRDLVDAVLQKATKPYILVSHFPEKTSKQILPLMFTPEPDNYYNIVFYTQGLDTQPQFSLPQPNFENTAKRNGFTAVEISYVSE